MLRAAMQRPLSLAALCLALAAAPLACSDSSGSANGPSNPPSGGGTAPDFSLPSTDGQTVRLSDYVGKKVVLINFWSTTCDPCLFEMPHIVELYKKHKDEGFEVLAVSGDGPESLGQVTNLAKAKGMIFPVLLDQETNVKQLYNKKGLMPYNVVVGIDGKISFERGNYSAGDEATLGAAVEKALADAKAAKAQPAK